MDATKTTPPHAFTILEPITESTNGHYDLATIRFQYAYTAEDCLLDIFYLIAASDSQMYQFVSMYCQEFCDPSEEIAIFFNQLRYWK